MKIFDRLTHCRSTLTISSESLILGIYKLIIKLVIWHNEPAIRFSHGDLKLDQVFIERVGSNFKFWLEDFGASSITYGYVYYLIQLTTLRHCVEGEALANISSRTFLEELSFFINGVKMGALPYAQPLNKALNISFIRATTRFVNNHDPLGVFQKKIDDMLQLTTSVSALDDN